jgi:Domain of unknown function (DUF1330)
MSEDAMTVYMLAQVQILDPEQWERYQEIAAREIARHGGGTFPAVSARTWKKPTGTSRKTCRSTSSRSPTWSRLTRGTTRPNMPKRWPSGRSRCTDAYFFVRGTDET